MLLQSSADQGTQLGWRLILGYLSTVFFGYAIPIWLFQYKVNPIDEILLATRMNIDIAVYVVQQDIAAAFTALLSPFVTPQFWLIYGRYGLAAGIAGAAILLLVDFVTFSLSGFQEWGTWRRLRHVRLALANEKPHGKADAASEDETNRNLDGKPKNQRRPTFKD